MIYLKECRCFAKTNTAFFSPLPHGPPPPPNNRFSLAFVTAASQISFCCRFTGALSHRHERVSHAKLRICSVGTFAQREANGGGSRDEQPKKPPSHAARDGLARSLARTAPCVASTWGSCSLCVAFARRLHGVRTLCAAPCTVSPPAQQLVTTGSPYPAGAGGRGRAGRGRLR